jgi:class 3 adenylate cyclase
MFRQAVTAELHLCLQMHGLGERLSWVYWLASLRGQLGRGLPLGLLVEFFEGRLSRRRLIQRLEPQRTSAEATNLARLLERSLAETRRSALLGRGEELNRYLIDFVVLRRDLKLAYRVYEAMDRIRLLDAPDEVRLSRSNGSLIEFPCQGDLGPVPRRIRGHAVIKADVRGSTRITEMLRARGLNPASHFSLNFFDPVTKLLPDFGAEKLFVEGDAVILAIFEYDGEGPGMAVARACGLARKILQVVALQNVLNRRHELPELELGLGITFLPEEPNFLYDEGHRIMISGAINRADRLSSSSESLRRAGFSPGHPGFRVALVRDRRAPHGQGEDLLRYNVNGIRLEESAFFKLQREMRLEQVRGPEGVAAHGLFFTGTYSDAAGRDRFLVVRHAPVRDWDGQVLGAVDPERRHFFEVIVDEALGNALRRPAA